MKMMMKDDERCCKMVQSDENSGKIMKHDERKLMKMMNFDGKR